MVGFKVFDNTGKALRMGGLAALTFVAMTAGATTALFAQANANKPAAPAAKPAQAQAQPGGAAAGKTQAAPVAGQAAPGGDQKAESPKWTKICETISTIANENQKDAKDQQKKNVKVCMTQVEWFVDIISGDTVGIAVRQVEGNDKQQLIVTMPPGVVIPAGVQAKIDDKEALKLPYTACHRLACSAEIEATPQIIDQMKKGKQITVAAVGLNLKAAGVQQSLEGFETAYNGQPVDSEKYKEERKKFIAALLDYRNKLIEKAKSDAAAKKNGENGTAAAQPPAAGNAPAKK